MRTVVITEPGPPSVLRIEERPAPTPGPDDILVRVRASGLNRADLLQRRGNYPPPPGYPADVPGLEYAGEIEAIGRDVTRWAVGDRVMGIVAGGAHAELIGVDQLAAVRVPANLDWPEAAAIPEAFMTAFDALFNLAGLQSAERVLIHAVGSGVGTAALQLAAAAGAETFGTSRSPDKLTSSFPLGLHHGFDGSDGSWIDAVTAIAPDGVQVVLDLVGGQYVADDLKIIASQGRIVLVGLVAGTRAELDLSRILRRRVRLLGTVLRSRSPDEKHALARQFEGSVLPLLESGVVRPVVGEIHPFDEVVHAHERLENNDVFGKVVLIW